MTGMIQFVAGLFILTVLSAILLDPVTALPWGLEPALQLLATTMHTLANDAPWLAVMLNVFIIGLLVKISLWVFDKVLWLIQLIRG